MNENLDNVQKQPVPIAEQKPTDEISGFVFSSAVKISDPNTKEILVQVRGDY